MGLLFDPTLYITPRGNTAKAERASLHGTTALSVTELLQLPASDYGTEQFTITSQRCGLVLQSRFRQSLQTFLRGY